MADIPIKNATDEKDQLTNLKIEISNGISLGFQIAVGFWFFTLIFAILVIIVLSIVGVSLTRII